MTITELLEIAEGRWPLPTVPVDVNLVNGLTDSPPLMRILRKVEWRENKSTPKSLGPSKRWLYWHWTPEARDDGRMDCGYSGLHSSNHLLAHLNP